MKRLMIWLDRMDRTILLVLLSALVVVVFLQVASRFVFKVPIEWSEEMSRFIFIWFCWLGCSYATCNYHHIRITAHFRVLPSGLAIWLLRLGDVLWIVFNLVVLVGGILYLESITQFPYRAMITDINMLWIFLPIPVIFVVFTLRVAVNLFDPDYFERTMGEAEGEAVEGAGSVSSEGSAP
jgi:C4-dicarboxylate transporter DctQ subunit